MQSIDEVIRLRDEAIQKLLDEKAGLQAKMASLSTRLAEVGGQLQRLGYSTLPEEPIEEGGSRIPKKPGSGLREPRGQYTIEQHLAGKPPAIVDLFGRLSAAIRGLGADVREAPLRHSMSYSTAHNFCGIVVQASKLWVYINIPGRKLRDPRGIAEDCSSIGHWASGDTRMAVAPQDNLDYVLSLIGQSYEWSRGLQ